MERDIFSVPLPRDPFIDQRSSLCLIVWDTVPKDTDIVSGINGAFGLDGEPLPLAWSQLREKFLPYELLSLLMNLF